MTTYGMVLRMGCFGLSCGVYRDTIYYFFILHTPHLPEVLPPYYGVTSTLWNRVVNFGIAGTADRVEGPGRRAGSVDRTEG